MFGYTPNAFIAKLPDAAKEPNISLDLEKKTQLEGENSKQMQKFLYVC